MINVSLSYEDMQSSFVGEILCHYVRICSEILIDINASATSTTFR